MAATRVFGVDPGSRLAGWACVEMKAGGKPRRAGSGVLRLGRKTEIGPRLALLRGALLELFAGFQPHLLALEAAYFGRNARSALRLGEARGVIIAAAAEAGLKLVELPPAVVKRRITGSGAAGKAQIAKLVAVHLDWHGEFATADESDALAVALCAALELGLPLVEPAARRRLSSLPQGASYQ